MSESHLEILGGTEIDCDKEYLITIKYNNYFPNLLGTNVKSTINETIKKMKNEILIRFKVPELFQNANLDNFDNADNFNVFTKVVEQSKLGFKSSMILWSKNIYGVGKTHLLYAMAKSYLVNDTNFGVKLENDNNVVLNYNALRLGLFIEYDLLNKIRDTFKPNNELTEGDIFKELNHYDVLFIDDLLKYTPSNLDFYQRVMFQIVNDRYNNKKSIILTTNKCLRELAELIGIATSDRLNEMTKDCQLEFKGKSHRGK